MAKKAKIAKKAAASRRERPGEYVGFRTPAEVKEKLEAAAQASNRSISSEAQFRLERSFEVQPFSGQFLTLAFGARTAALVLMIARVMFQTGALTVPQSMAPEPSKDWTDDPFAFGQVENAVRRILEAARPTGTQIRPRHLRADGLPADHPLHREDIDFGSITAASLIGSVIGHDGSFDTQQWGVSLRELLGPLVERMKKLEANGAVSTGKTKS